MSGPTKCIWPWLWQSQNPPQLSGPEFSPFRTGERLSLRFKTASLIGVAVLLLVSALYAVLAKRNTDESLVLERSEVARILKQATSTIESEYQSLETLTLDWAVWDTAYDFVRF